MRNTNQPILSWFLKFRFFISPPTFHNKGFILSTSLSLVLILNLWLASSLASSKEAPIFKPDGTAIEITRQLKESPLKSVDTSNPRATFKSFNNRVYLAYLLLKDAHQKNMSTPGLLTPEKLVAQGKLAQHLMDQAVLCMDLSKIPQAIRRNWGYEGALFLKEIFDRIQLPPLSDIPSEVDFPTAGKAEKRKLESWTFPDTRIVITLINEGERKGEYLFSAQNMPLLDEFYEKVKHLPYKKDDYITPDFLTFYDSTPGELLPPKWSQYLPAWSQSKQFYFQTIWQWGGLFLTVIVILALGWFFCRKWMSINRYKTISTKNWGWAIILFIIGITISTGLHIISIHIHITGPVLSFLKIVFPLLSYIFYSLGIFFAGRAIGQTIIDSPRIDPNGIHASLIMAVSVSVGAILAVYMVTIGLTYVGLSPVPLFAGLGVGGLAFALAARPTLANLIGGFMVLADRPYRIGQRVLVKNYKGDIEKIGLRSTRIRLLTGHQVIIPNEEMASVVIENIDRRPFIRRKMNLSLTYGTPPGKIERGVEIIMEILENHEGMPPDFPPKVYFDEFNADSLNIMVRYWYQPPDLWKYYEFSQNVNLRIMKAFEKEGIDFAFPTVTNILTQDEDSALTFKVEKSSAETF